MGGIPTLVALPAPSVTAPAVASLLDSLDGISGAVSTISSDIGNVLKPDADILDPDVLGSLAPLIDNLGATGPILTAISSALDQFQALGRTLSAIESALLIQRFNNGVVQSYSQLLQKLDSSRPQIGQPSIGGLVNDVLGATTFIRAVSSNLSQGLARLVVLSAQFIQLLNPAYKPAGQQVTDGLQNLVKMSIDVYQV
ncbi:hypothetical protein LZ30DRAFT_609928 [Colletotrichum cereale]|nr:hypothetical protein LZ30DRAFT_609928 [Colletotrichum cereale]